MPSPKFRVERNGPEWLMSEDGRLVGYRDERGIEHGIPNTPFLGGQVTDRSDVIRPTMGGQRTLTVGIVGASLAARAYVWREIAGSLVRREGDTIIVSGFTHGLSQGEWFCVRSRQRILSTAKVRPTIVSTTELRMPALFPGLGDATHPGSGNSDWLTSVYWLSRYDYAGSYLRHMSMNPTIAGRINVAEFLAQGGDNEPEMAAKYETEIIPAAQRLASVGGILMGNWGGDLVSWQPPEPINITRFREVTALGCMILQTEGGANSPLAPDDSVDTIRQVAYARWVTEREAERNPLLLMVNRKEVLVDRTHPAGSARPGLHVDNVHFNQAGSKLAGAADAAIVAPILGPYVRVIRDHRGDQWTTGPVPIGGNVAVGLFSNSGTVTATMAAGAPGTTNISGTMDSSIAPLRKTGTATLTVTASVTNNADGTRSQRFVVSKDATNNASLRIPIQGATGVEWWRQMVAGEYEQALRYVLADNPTRLQALEIYADTGEGTLRLGAFSSAESVEYSTGDLTRAEMTVGESGAAWFPENLVFPTAPTNFRLVLQLVFVTGVAGAATIDIQDYVTRRVL